MSKKDKTPPAQPAAHVLTFLSTKPGHKVLRKEKCTCSQGRDHSQYETPSE